MKGSSSELQKISLSILMKDQYIFSKCCNEISERFFSSLSYKLIFKVLLKHYNEYLVLPTFNELLLLIKENYKEEYGPLESIINEAESLSNEEMSSEDFAYDKLLEFIKRNKIENALSKTIDYANGGEINLNTVSDDLLSSMNISIRKTKVHRLSNTEDLKEIKSDALGPSENPIIIKLCLDVLNRCFQYGGMIPGTLNQLIAAPGCFVSRTKILMSDGSVRTISSLEKHKDNNNIYGCTPDGIVTKDKFEDVVLVDYVNELQQVVIDDNQKIKCTVDHPFMMKDGTYKRADELKVGDMLMSLTIVNGIVVPHCFHCVTGSWKLESDYGIAVYGIVNSGVNHNYALSFKSSNEEGFFVSNTGKTSFAINQGVCTAKQGYRVLHVFLGDMTNWDGLLRYLSCLSGVDTSKLIELDKASNLDKFISKYNMTGVLGLIDTVSYASCELTVTQLIEEIKIIQRQLKVHYDLIIVDYDENINKEGDSMYEEGGDVYNKLGFFAVSNMSVVLVLTQPKPQFWKQEILTLDTAAESSKKGKIIDFLLTIGKPSRESTIGSAFIGKNRRGVDGKIVRLKFTGSNCRIEQITDEEYTMIKNSEKTVS